ncbi:MAG: hypothetical protein GX270_10370 [Clostridiaceae bacterium]|jgi:hypothetical protein|nr:hypothetical protein [Clostridiaceae bacterium]
MSNNNSLSTLDNIRLSRGTSELSDYFHRILIRNTSAAAKLINEDNLRFPSLFILLPQISRASFVRHLNPRNKATLMITDSIRSKNFSNFTHISQRIDVNAPEILKWIIDTSKDDTLARGEYIDILDCCAIILVKEYRDNSMLHSLKEIIYNRYKHGLFIYDLVWAFFECRDPNCILMLAEGLNSPDEKDVELSKKLLKFVPILKNSNLPNDILYNNISYWFRDNYPFIYYTGECFQQMPDPCPYAVSLSAKYLFKKVPDDGSLESTLTQTEIRLKNTFDTLDINSQILLSNYSFILHNQNIYWWNNWINYPISEQLRISVAKLGGKL